jgi:hypothetical protein
MRRLDRSDIVFLKWDVVPTAYPVQAPTIDYDLLEHTTIFERDGHDGIAHSGFR